MAKIDLIKFDARGAFIPQLGINAAQIEALKSRLMAARDEVLIADQKLYDSQSEVPAEIPIEKTPLDAGFLEMPERILDAYQSDRTNSELGRILDAAARMRDKVDKVVVLGIGGSYMGARAMMETCCQPYFNEYSRAERGGRPRMYFEGNNVDNDWSQQLLHFLDIDSKGKGDGPASKWGIVVISKSGGTLETAAAFRQFLAALQKIVGREKLPEYVIPVSGETGKLARLADAIGCRDRFIVPDGVGGRFSVLSPVGLLPGALLGIDIVKMLEGAAAMNSHFRSAPIGENAVLDYVAVNHLLEVEQGVDIRVLSVWSKSLEAAGYWYDQLLAESLGKNEQGAFPLTCVNSRDLHSRAQQHQEGSRDKVMNNVILNSWRHSPLPIGSSEWDQDQLNELANKTLPQVMEAAIAGTNQAYQEDKRPTTNILLPAANESSLGQFFQMMMLATVVEGRLLGINPYGQPGVEKYKTNMNRLLRNLILIAVGFCIWSNVASVFAQEKPQLIQWKLSAGDQFQVESVQQTHTSTVFSKRTVVNNQATTLTMDWNVQQIDEQKNAIISQTISRIRLNVGNPAIPDQAIALDSDLSSQSGSGATKLAKQLKPLIGLQWLVTMSPTGEIVETVFPENTEEVLAALATTNGHFRTIEKRVLASMIKDFTIVLPTKKLAPGESWQTTRIVSVGPPAIQRETNIVFDGVKSQDNSRLARFKLTTNFQPVKTSSGKSESASTGTSTSRETISATDEGQFLFDIEAGHLASSKSSNTITTNFEYAGEEFETTTESHYELKIQKK